MREVAFKEGVGGGGGGVKRGRDPVSGRTRSDMAGTETLNKTGEGRERRELHRQTDENTQHILHRLTASWGKNTSGLFSALHHTYFYFGD